MISIKEYLKNDIEKNRYTLPLSFFENIKYMFFTKFLENSPLSQKIFISNENYKKYYWEIIINYLKKELDINFRINKSVMENRLLQFTATVSNKNEKEDYVAISGHGNDKNSEDTTISKAIGEFLERHSSAYVSEVFLQNEVTKISYKVLSEQVKTVRDYHDFSTSQYESNPNIVIKDEDIFSVIKVEDLLNNKKVLYPLRQIFWRLRDKKEKNIANITTSGCGGGFGMEEASLSGIYEAIERDSFFCHWLTKTSPDKLTILPGQISLYDEYKKILEEINYQIYILNTTTNLEINSCICIVKNLNTNGICVSGGADFSLEKAVIKSLKESMSCIKFFNSDNFFDLDEKYIPFITKDLSREERLDLAKNGKYFENYQFFISGKNVDFVSDSTQYQFKSKQEEFQSVVNKLVEKGIPEIYRYVFKNKILQKLGYSVVRVIIPKLYQLYLTENLCLIENQSEKFSLLVAKKDFFL